MARKEKEFHFIYKTTNILTNKYYYGMHSTNNLTDGYMGSGKRLRRSIIKYGKENHKVEIIEFLSDRKSLVEREKEIVNLNEIAKDDCMNIMVGGQGGLISEEHLIKMRHGASKYLLNQWKNDEYRHKISNSSKKNMIKNHKLGKMKYDNFTGRHHSDKTIELMKEIKINHGIGNKNSQFSTCWIIKNGINKKIKNDDLPIFINEGWCKGRILKKC